MAIRLIDAGIVSHLRSQALYHGLARALEEDTVVLCTPGEPYVCIGFHQDPEHELDLAFCRDAGLPVLRRETGGGAVYLDRDQLFVQWIMGGVMGESRLPARVDARFELFARPLVATYQAFGIDARFVPVNDVQVGDRKITGTGAVRIGEAEVLIGNFLFDFDIEVMARVLRERSAPFRAQVGKSLRRYMTSMARELDAAPDPAAVAKVYRAQCARALGEELVPGELSAAETTAVEEAERQLGSEHFLHRPGGLRRAGGLRQEEVKIHEDVRVVESVLDVEDGPLRVTARLRKGEIEDIALTRAEEQTP